MNKSTVQPMWGPYTTIRALFGMPRGWLDELVKSGHVRRRSRRKGARQARCIYRVADVAAYLDGDGAEDHAA
jgi:hypothetical protein